MPLPNTTTPQLFWECFSRTPHRATSGGRRRENVSTGFQEELVPKPRSEAWSWSKPDEVGSVVDEEHSICKGLEATGSWCVQAANNHNAAELIRQGGVPGTIKIS